MVVKKAPTPPGCDYEPMLGAHKRISFGLIKATNKGPVTLADAIGKRWYPVMWPVDLIDGWPPTTAHHAEVLLTKGAPEHFSSVHSLCAAYHSGRTAVVLDLAAQITIRFEGVDAIPQVLRLHDALEVGRGYALRLARKLEAAAVFTMHVPASSGYSGPAHCHIIIPARHVLPGSGFGRFIAEVVNPEEGRRLIDEEWSSWIAESGYDL